MKSLKEICIGAFNKRIKIIPRLKLVIILLLFGNIGLCQEFSRSSLKTGVGFGFNEGMSEIGLGSLFLVGYQKSFVNDRLRISPNFTAGNYIPLGVTDTRDQYYRITSFNVNANLDIFKKPFGSLYFGTGAFLAYSRGLMGTGGMDEYSTNSTSKYFFKLYYGINLSTGIRVVSKSRRVVYDLSPINIQIGNKYFVIGFMKFGVDINFYSKQKSESNLNLAEN